MNNFEDLAFEQNFTWCHQSRIAVNFIDDLKCTDELKYLLGEVFQYHPINGTHEFDQNGFHPNAHFYRNHYVDTELTYRTGEKTYEKIDQRRLINRLARALVRDQQINPFWLMGEIGSGKSTYVSNLLTKNIFSLVSSKIIVTRLDVRSIFPAGKMHDGSIIHPVKACDIYKSIINQIKGNQIIGLCEEDDQPSSEYNYHPDLIDEATRSHMLNLIRGCKKNGYKVVIVLDNIDSISHIQDRCEFASSDKALEVKSKISNNIDELIRSLTSNDSIGQQNCYTLIICSRSDTAFAFYPDIYDDHNKSTRRYYIARLSREEACTKAIEVKQSYISYFKHKILQLPKIRPSEKNTISKINAYWDFLERVKVDKDNDLKRIINLSGRGLRDTIERFDGIFTFRDDGLDERLSANTILFLTNRMMRYSQLQSNFCNIFLINTGLIDFEMFTDCDKDPGYSVWLKWLILYYLINCDTKRMSRQPERIISYFSSNAYHKGLVEACIGGLYDKKTCSVIDYDDSMRALAYPLSTASMELKVTHRGDELINWLMETFLYMETIVDDPGLIIPMGYRNDINSINDFIDDVNYGYFLISDQEIERRSRSKMVFGKILKVLFFIDFLKRSWRHESQRYSSLFQRMNRDFSITSDPPPFLDTVLAKAKSSHQSIDFPITGFFPPSPSQDEALYQNFDSPPQDKASSSREFRNIQSVFLYFEERIKKIESAVESNLTKIYEQ